MNNNTSINKKIGPLPILALIFGASLLVLQSCDSLFSFFINWQYGGWSNLGLLIMHTPDFISCVLSFISLAILLIAVAFLWKKAAQKYVYSISYIMAALFLAFSQILSIIAYVIEYYSFTHSIRAVFIQALTNHLIELFLIFVITVSVIISFAVIMTLKGEKFKTFITVFGIIGCVFLALIFLVLFIIDYISYFDIMRYCFSFIYGVLTRPLVLFSRGGLFYICWIMRFIVIPLIYLFDFLYFAFGILGGAKIAIAKSENKNASKNKVV